MGGGVSFAVMLLGLLLLASSAYAETCGSANALAFDSAFDDDACGAGFFANSDAAATACAAGDGLLADDAANACTKADDKAACCVAQAQCQTGGLVTDAACGAGFIYNTNSAAQLCAGAACDVAGVEIDKAQCCVAQAQCQTDGLVDNAACGVDYV